MKCILTLISLLFIGFNSIAQPFRYIKGNDYDRDSIKLLKIKGYKEYTALYSDTSNKKLSQIVEYDTNGNLTRKVLIDFNDGRMNQWTYTYSPTNLLLEYGSYFPDTLTRNQRVKYKYDQNGNQIEILSENFFEGKISSSSRTVQCHNGLNQLIELKQYDSNNKFRSHYEYAYDDFGNKIEELVYSESGKLLYRRDTRYQFRDSEEMYGLPTNRDPLFDEQLKQKTTYNLDGKRILEEGSSIRIFNKQDILLQLIEKNFRHKWFEYTYYKMP